MCGVNVFVKPCDAHFVARQTLNSQHSFSGFISSILFISCVYLQLAAFKNGKKAALTCTKLVLSKIFQMEILINILKINIHVQANGR